MTKQLENYLNHYNYVVGEPCRRKRTGRLVPKLKQAVENCPITYISAARRTNTTRLSRTMKSRSYYLSRNARTNDKLAELIGDIASEHAQQARMRKDVKSIKSVALFFLIISIIGFAVMFLNIASIARILH